VEEFAALRGSLEELSKEFDLDFALDIEILDEKIAAWEDEPDKDDSDSEETGVLRSAETIDERIITDDDVRQMFNTLRDTGES
jgi:hypothetical protein